MKVESNLIPDAIWLRDIDENGTRRITLRRNFTEETGIGEEPRIVFDEVDVVIKEQENMMEFITKNFGNLFELGLQQVAEGEPLG